MSNSSRSGHLQGRNLSTTWSEWGFDEQKNCEVRYRLDEEGQYEYDYDKEAYNRQQNAVAVPRTPHTNALEPIAESPAGQYYTSNPTLSSLTNSAAQPSLTPNSNSIPLSQNSTAVDASYSGQPIAVRTSNPYTNREEFDPNYQVHPSSEFRWGRIFKVLWTEPKGNGSESSTVGTRSVRQGPYGQPVYSKVRRFVIIKEERGHCICLPIVTYGSQGTNKRGVHANHHTIIYTEQPRMIHGEGARGLTKRPIRVIPYEPQHKLDPASRLNYAKIYTVEHNVKVWFIGKLAEESEQTVVIDYNEVNPPLYRPTPNIPVATGSNVSYAQGGSSNFNNFESAPRGNRGYSTSAGIAPNPFYSSTTQPLSRNPSNSSHASAYSQQYQAHGNYYQQPWPGNTSYPSGSHQGSSAYPSNATDEQSGYYGNSQGNYDQGG